MTKGIVTTIAVGNNNSKIGLGSNLAPWLISVAAGTTDPKFVTDVVNGDGKTATCKDRFSFLYSVGV